MFISSTYEDLKEARQAVQDSVLTAGDFPVQMEYFPATDETAFDLIISLLDKCDYYVLIIGGRYGTLDTDGLSYTHKEFRYAISRNIPVIVMLHGARGKISAEKTEQTAAGKKRLEDFIIESSQGRTRATWSEIGELRAKVLAALSRAKQVKPAIGWIRGDAVASVDVLEELNSVRRENAKYRDTIGNLEIDLALPPIPASTDPVEIDLIPATIDRGSKGERTGSYARVRHTWLSAFSIFFDGLKWSISDWGGEVSFYINREESYLSIGARFAAEFASFDTEGLFCISASTFSKLQSYYIEVGLMVTSGESPFTETAQKLARRHQINGGQNEKPSVVKGSIDLKETFAGRPDLPDEIPF